MNTNAIMVACSSKNILIVRELLKRPELNLNVKNDYGSPLLVIACYNNHIALVSEVIKHSNIDINCQNEQGDTPLICACLYNRIELIKELLTHPNINLNIKNLTGFTALGVTKSAEIIKLINNYSAIRSNNLKYNVENSKFNFIEL